MQNDHILINNNNDRSESSNDNDNDNNDPSESSNITDYWNINNIQYKIDIVKLIIATTAIYINYHITEDADFTRESILFVLQGIEVYDELINNIRFINKLKEKILYIITKYKVILDYTNENIGRNRIVPSPIIDNSPIPSPNVIPTDDVQNLRRSKRKRKQNVLYTDFVLKK